MKPIQSISTLSQLTVGLSMLLPQDMISIFALYGPKNEKKNQGSCLTAYSERERKHEPGLFTGTSRALCIEP